MELDMASIPAEDPETYEMISLGDTVGVFQIESRAQMSMLPRLRPQCFYDLVVEISIIRPGPITGGMVHPYLRRRRGEEPVGYPHPSLKPVLEKTLGVPLFQEQVMRLAMVAADYTPGEADQLRRDMAAWRRKGRIGRHRERLIQRMGAKGIAEEFAERVFQQIQGFGEYGFPESHAASFALISYATAWLKRHYPAEFTCALLNAQPMGFYSPATVIEDAKRRGIDVRPASVVHSAWDCTLESSGKQNTELRIQKGEFAHHVPQTTDHQLPQFAVRMGLRYIKGLSRGDFERIEAARRAAPLTSVEDLVARTGLDRGILPGLAQAGALEALTSRRRDALWAVLGAAPAGRNRVPPSAVRPVKGQGERRRPEAGRRTSRQALPMSHQEIPAEFPDLSSLETVLWDYRAQGHSARSHPLAAVRRELRAQGLPTAAEVASMAHGRRVRYAGLVICRQRPGTARGVTFLTLEDETGFVNVVVWQHVYARHMTLVKTSPLLGVAGDLQVEDKVVHLVARSFWAPDVRLGGAHGPSRDFH
jgi:error-prone DNA polymerase